MEILRETKSFCDTILSYLYFLIQINLTSVCFIRDTDDIVSLGEELRIFCEFVNRREKYASTLSLLEKLSQICTALHAHDGIITDKSFCIRKLF